MDQFILMKRVRIISVSNSEDNKKVNIVWVEVERGGRRGGWKEKFNELIENETWMS